MEKEKKLTVESVHEEEKVMDEFDMTEIAKNIGCFTPAPKQQNRPIERSILPFACGVGAMR